MRSALIQSLLKEDTDSTLAAPQAISHPNPQLEAAVNAAA